MVPPGSVARSLAIMGGATAIGQGALVVSAPVVARLYDPAAFGILAVYTAVLSVLVAVASLRYDFAIPIAQDRSEAVHLVVLSVTLALGAGVIAALAIFMWGTPLALMLGVPSLASYMWLLPCALVVASITQALASWAVYDRSFEALGRMRAVQGVGQAAFQTVLGILHVGPLGLLAGDLAGRTLGTQQLSRSVLASLRSTQLSVNGVRRQARKTWKFARVMTAASFLSAVSLQLPFLLIPMLFTLEAAGQYFLAYRVLILPASLVAAAFSQVFFGEAAFRRSNAPDLQEFARNAVVALLIFSIPTYGMVTVVGPALIQTAFGDEWMPAGQYAQIIAPWLMLQCVASPISGLLVIGRREGESLAFTAAGLTLEAAAIGIGAAMDSLIAGLVILSITSVLLTLGSLWRFLRVANVGLRELGRPASRILAMTLPSLVAVGILAAVSPAWVLLAAAVGWTTAIGLAGYRSPELHAFLRGTR